jgi:UDP-sugar diphosphatase
MNCFSVAVVLFNATTNKLIFVRQFRPAVYLATLCNRPDSEETLLSGLNKSQTSGKKNPNLGFTLELCAGIIDKEGIYKKYILLKVFRL